MTDSMPYPTDAQLILNKIRAAIADEAADIARKIVYGEAEPKELDACLHRAKELEALDVLAKHDVVRLLRENADSRIELEGARSTLERLRDESVRLAKRNNAIEHYLSQLQLHGSAETRALMRFAIRMRDVMQQEKFDNWTDSEPKDVASQWRTTLMNVAQRTEYIRDILSSSMANCRTGDVQRECATLASILMILADGVLLHYVPHAALSTLDAENQPFLP